MKPVRKRSCASAPAKVILFGEHFVVYGKPAVLAAIDKRIHVRVTARNDDKIMINSNMNFRGSFSRTKAERAVRKNFHSMTQPILAATIGAMNEFDSFTGLDIRIDAGFPYAVGLGSSAATAVATVAAVGSLFGRLSKQRICEVSLDAERIVHKNPSGADSAICTYGGLMLFEKGKEARPIKTRLDLPLVVVDSGVKRVTGKIVASVSKLRKSDSDVFDGLSNMSHGVTLQALDAIRRKDYAEIGSLMTLNHSLLRMLGVSTNTLDMIIHKALNGGAIGAKLTGAGGGGCVIALAGRNSQRNVLKSVRGYDAFATKLESRGVLIS